jgi:glycosyltransferase involved in cell wall biosynthesis
VNPLVSVVIPTYRRPQLVKRAIASALNQTLTQIEVIVVINGETEGATRLSLAEIDDPRFRILELPVNLGSAAPARNVGVEVARANWIAHLDDDDEWLPEKLERQYNAVINSDYVLPIATCHLTVRTSHDDTIAPKRTPQNAEHISDYLFVRNSYFQGEALIQGSTLFTSKELMQKVPFDIAASKHDDWDWLLRACAIDGVGIEFLPEALSIWYLDNQHTSFSRTHDWQRSLDWIRARQNLVTRRAYASFLLVEIASHAAFNRDWQAFGLLLWEAVRFGKPRPVDFSLFFGMWLIPPTGRDWLRNLLSNKPQSTVAPIIN